MLADASRYTIDCVVHGARFRKGQQFKILALVVLTAMFGNATTTTYGQVPDTFAQESGQATFSFTSQQGMIILPVSIAGSAQLNFVLDSGSTRTLIDKSVALGLGLKTQEESSLQGAGAGRIPIQAIHDVMIELPGLQSTHYDCFATDLKSLESNLGVRVDGILGYDFFARFVVSVDFEKKVVTVERPSAFHPAQNQTVLPLEIKNKWPFIKATLKIDGHSPIVDTFFIDSGSSDAVDHPIVKSMQNKTPSKSGVGLGTPVEGSIATASSFAIGPYVMGGPIVVSCCGASEATSRLIGTEVLRRFTVTFDYTSSRLFLRPNGAYRETSRTTHF